MCQIKLIDFLIILFWKSVFCYILTVKYLVKREQIFITLTKKLHKIKGWKNVISIKPREYEAFFFLYLQKISGFYFSSFFIYLYLIFSLQWNILKDSILFFLIITDELFLYVILIFKYHKSKSEWRKVLERDTRWIPLDYETRAPTNYAIGILGTVVEKQQFRQACVNGLNTTLDGTLLSMNVTSFVKNLFITRVSYVTSPISLLWNRSNTPIRCIRLSFT